MDATIGVDVSIVDDAAVVRVRGEVDAESAPTLEVELAARPAQSAVRLDLAEVDFMDSTGVRVLVTQLCRFRDAGGSLTIDRASVSVRRLMEICGLDRLLGSDRLAS